MGKIPIRMCKMLFRTGKLPVLIQRLLTKITNREHTHKTRARGFFHGLELRMGMVCVILERLMLHRVFSHTPLKPPTITTDIILIFNVWISIKTDLAFVAYIYVRFRGILNWYSDCLFRMRKVIDFLDLRYRSSWWVFDRGSVEEPPKVFVLVIKC